MAFEQRHHLLGVDVDAMTIADIQAAMERCVNKGQRHIIANHNLHSVYLYHNDPTTRAFYEKATYTHVDGMALVMVGRMLGLPLTRRHRLTYLDTMPLILNQMACKGWRVFYLGSRPGVASRGAAILRRHFPNLQIGTAHGYFDARPGSPANQRVIAAINEFAPHVLFVGMGMPRQEQWIVANFSQLETNLILNVGGYMDYLSGEVATPPRWAGRVGLEWFFRLCAEPRRLWRRYLVEPWFLLGVLLNDFRHNRNNLLLGPPIARRREFDTYHDASTLGQDTAQLGNRATRRTGSFRE